LLELVELCTLLELVELCTLLELVLSYTQGVGHEENHTVLINWYAIVTHDQLNNAQDATHGRLTLTVTIKYNPYDHVV
jgi:hypothetical protein